jgi:CelD/BcsL family acetyltransferase involved in cellulose biosynthesis
MTAAAPHTDNTYRLRVYSHEEDWAGLADAWRDLETRDSRAQVFQTFTWLSHIWQLDRGPKAGLRLVAVYQPDGRLAAMVPLTSERTLGPIGVRVLQFIGRGPSDYLDILLADDCDHHAAITLLAKWFDDARKKHDVIVLDHIAEGAHLIKHHLSLFPTSSAGSADIEHTDTTRYFQVPDGFEQYLASVSKSRRTHFRQHWRRLNEGYRVEVAVPDRGEDADEDMAKMMQLHQARQNFRGQRGMFRGPDRIALFTCLFKALIDEGRARLWTLKLDDRAYASEVVLNFNGTAIDYNGGWDDDPAMKRHGLRNLLLFKAFEQACTLPETRWFDLGIGDEDYKASFAKLTRPIFRLSCRLPGFRARLYHLYHRSLDRAYASPWVQRVYFTIRTASKDRPE